MRQALIIASIPAAIALLGVIATVAVGERRAATAAKDERAERKADREHQAQLDRDRFMRTERLAAYRVLIESASAFLIRTAFEVVPGGKEQTFLSSSATAEWTSALTLAQLVGASPVIQAAQGVEEIRKKRLRQRAMVSILREHEAAGDAATGPLADAAKESTATSRTALFGHMMEENDLILLALIDACRADIAALQD